MKKEPVRPLSFEAPQSLISKLDQYAAETRRSRSATIRILVEEGLRQPAIDKLPTKKGA